MTGEWLAVARARALGTSGLGRRIRVDAGLSLRDVAQAVQVDPSTLHRWERGECVPRQAAALRWLQVMETLVADVWKVGA